MTEEIARTVARPQRPTLPAMLRPEVISDLNLADHGLRMVPCDPAIQVQHFRTVE